MGKIFKTLISSFVYSLLMAYCLALGYYLQFNIDVSSYLSVEDLTLVFSKYIWLIMGLVFFILLSFEKLVDLQYDEENWWNKTITRILVKRSIFIVIPILGMFILLAIKFKWVTIILIGLFAVSLILLVLLTLLELSIEKFKDEDALAKSTFKDWLYPIEFILLGLILIPLLSGVLVASNFKCPDIVARFNDEKVLDTTLDTQKRYVGKTKDYLFINDIKTNSTTVYSMSSIVSIEYLTKK